MIRCIGYCALLFIAVIPQYLFACDICALSQSPHVESMRSEAVHLSLAQQWTSYDKLQQSGKRLEDPNKQRLHSAITQLAAGVDITDRFGFQFNLPYIHRRYRRIEDGAVKTGSEEGIGDLSLLARVSLLQRHSSASSYLVHLFGGIKLPTGSAYRLKEELAGADHDDHTSMQMKHGDNDQSDEAQSAVHGHDLAIGSGSVDIPLGSTAVVRYGPWLARGEMQYLFRTTGDYSYRYADHLTYSIAPSYLFLQSARQMAGVGIALSGEYKGKDSGEGDVVQHDTGTRSTYLGPQLWFSTHSKLAGELSLDIPLDVNNTDLQVVPSYRLRAGVSYRF